MAKSESKSGWEAVKPTKTGKSGQKVAEKDQKSKSPPKAKIIATNTSPKENQKSKSDVSSMQ